MLFAPIAVGFLLLERTARAHARGEPTERPLFVALGFVFATSGLAALAYIVAPAFFVNLVVALATQAVAIVAFFVERSGQTRVALTPR